MNSTINTIIIAATLLIITFFAYGQVSSFIKNQAINDCMHVASNQSQTGENSSVTTPETYWYNLCMKEKGYKK